MTMSTDRKQSCKSGRFLLHCFIKLRNGAKKKKDGGGSVRIWVVPVGKDMELDACRLSDVLWLSNAPHNQTTHHLNEPCQELRVLRVDVVKLLATNLHWNAFLFNSCLTVLCLSCFGFFWHTRKKETLLNAFFVADVINVDGVRG